jgi:hypothetical protein
MKCGHGPRYWNSNSHPYGIIHNHREDTRFDEIHHPGRWQSFCTTSKLVLCVILLPKAKLLLHTIRRHFCYPTHHRKQRLPDISIGAITMCFYLILMSKVSQKHNNFIVYCLISLATSFDLRSHHQAILNHTVLCVPLATEPGISFQNMARRVQSCLEANGGHFQHMLWCHHISYTMR